MAMGLIQYANLEATAHAHVASDKVKQGDFYGALREVAARCHLPAGWHGSQDRTRRQVLVSSKAGTTQVTAVTPVDGRWLLAAIAGLKNGDLLWQTLQAAAATLSKDKDKNAEGRELST
jgi:hypothetical protein